jgi:hypothetical protein
MEITIHHPSSSGEKRIKRIVGVTDAMLDYGHEINETIVPAIRIESTEARPYYVSGIELTALETLFIYIKANISLNKNTVIPLDVFDPDTNKEVKPMSISQYLNAIKWQRFSRTEAFAIFCTEDIRSMTHGKFNPVKRAARERKETIIELWRHRLPTTQADVSKKEYFTALLSEHIVL